LGFGLIRHPLRCLESLPSPQKQHPLKRFPLLSWTSSFFSQSFFPHTPASLRCVTQVPPKGVFSYPLPVPSWDQVAKPDTSNHPYMKSGVVFRYQRWWFSGYLLFVCVLYLVCSFRDTLGQFLSQLVRVEDHLVVFLRKSPAKFFFFYPVGVVCLLWSSSQVALPL